MFFSYYGSKSKIAKHYAAPQHDVIVEPFCGAANYALHGDNWKKCVYLLDKFEVIAEIWEYLIGADEERILSLPDFAKGERIDAYPHLTRGERLLIGFLVNRGCSSPCQTASNWNFWNKKKLYLAKNLYKIRHWKVKCGDYRDLRNCEATWFIDPPYQFGGEHYQTSASNRHIDFTALANWCRSRRGQVIVCENTKANWLPFEPLAKLHGQKHDTTEAIWYNNSSSLMEGN